MSKDKNSCAPSCCNDVQVDAKNKDSSTGLSSNASSIIEQNSHRESVREVYSHVANSQKVGSACSDDESCCGSSDEAVNTLISTKLGYAQVDLDLVPEGADMGLGCGNPQTFADLQEGDIVIDLGSGGGVDCFLAANQIGKTGRAIGVDMTPDMVSKARNNADKGQYHNVEFRLGEIEQLPVADNSADVIISNCVINLSPDKAQVFREAYRVLKRGGRMAISDVVATIELPDEMKNDPKLIAGCMGNAALISDLQADIEAAGFRHVSIKPKDSSRDFIKDWAPNLGVEDYVVSASIEAYK